jgi:hypothetical protein
MYSTIQEAWNDDIVELYSNNFQNNNTTKTKPNIDNFNNNSIQYFDINEDYDNIHEYYKPKLKNSNKVSSSTKKVKKKKFKKPKSIVTSSAKSTSTTISKKYKYKKKHIPCKDVFKKIKECKKCRRKVEKYINRNKIVIDLDPIEVRKMLLCLILIGMIIILINMLSDRKSV